jgi:hypothetical protein
MSDTKETYRIHPAAGFTRVGNSPRRFRERFRGQDGAGTFRNSCPRDSRSSSRELGVMSPHCGGLDLLL